MTKEQRAEVWARKDRFTAQLKAASSESEKADIKAKIDGCNYELTSDNYNPPIVEELPESST